MAEIPTPARISTTRKVGGDTIIEVIPVPSFTREYQVPLVLTTHTQGVEIRVCEDEFGNPTGITRYRIIGCEIVVGPAAGIPNAIGVYLSTAGGDTLTDVENLSGMVADEGRSLDLTWKNAITDQNLVLTQTDAATTETEVTLVVRMTDLSQLNP